MYDPEKSNRTREFMDNFTQQEEKAAREAISAAEEGICINLEGIQVVNVKQQNATPITPDKNIAQINKAGNTTIHKVGLSKGSASADEASAQPEFVVQRVRRSAKTPRVSQEALIFGLISK
jgi:hypothetical protein